MVETIAGNGANSYKDGQGTSSSFKSPLALSADKYGNIFVADRENHMIRKINASGYVSTYAGNGVLGFSEGPSDSASFNSPSGITVDSFGIVYVSDTSNNRIATINKTGYVHTLAGNGVSGDWNGDGANSEFNGPIGIAVDSFENVYVADSINNKIKMIDRTGYVHTVAGGGLGSFADGQDILASFWNPTGIAIDPAGNLVVVDSHNNRIRKNYVSMLAGNSTAGFADGETNVLFSNPFGICADSLGSMYITDRYNYKVRVYRFTGYVQTVAGSGVASCVDGDGSAADFLYLGGITIFNNIVYVADAGCGRIKKITEISPSSSNSSDGTVVIVCACLGSLGVIGVAGVALKRRRSAKKTTKEILSELEIKLPQLNHLPTSELESLTLIQLEGLAEITALDYLKIKKYFRKNK